MAIREIVQSAGNNAREEVLRRRAEEVVTDNLDAALGVVADLKDTIASQPLCVGLAANQIGSGLSVAVIKTDAEPLVLINPRVVSATGKKDRKRESCMSVWGLTGDVERRDKVLFSYQDEDLKPQEMQLSGFAGRIVQHEIDHLQGILYTDHAGSSVRPTDLFDEYSPKLT